jgi:hypothetical protein
MLDTNSLYSPHATNQFVAPALVEVIEDDAHKSLNINWVISEMVRSEREYHLRREARHVISAARKIPEVFSSTWVCDEDAVFAQVSNFAQRELDRLKVSVRGCDSGRVDWPSLIAAAGLRLPPFDPNLEKEKGFKDAIVAETFLQLCGDLPAHGSETAILVSDDTMLGDQVAKRVDGAKVKVLKDLDELRNELNFLSSDIPAEVAALLPGKSTELIANNKEFWDNVYRIAVCSYQQAFTLTPDIVELKTLGSNYTLPIFLRKEMRRVHFVCRYLISRSAMRWVANVMPQPNPAVLLARLDDQYYAPGTALSGTGRFEFGRIPQPPGASSPPTARQMRAVFRNRREACRPFRGAWSPIR